MSIDRRNLLKEMSAADLRGELIACLRARRFAVTSRRSSASTARFGNCSRPKP